MLLTFFLTLGCIAFALFIAKNTPTWVWAVIGLFFLVVIFQMEKREFERTTADVRDPLIRCRKSCSPNGTATGEITAAQRSCERDCILEQR